jgi:RNA polymerase-binding transcription factor DksA
MKAEPRPTKRAPRRKLPQAMLPRAKAENIPAKWRWHYRVLQALREHLVDQRSAALAEAATPIESHSMDPTDSATDEFDRELAVSLLSGEQDALYAVDSAIKRITTGAYGICEKTGKRIPMQRLRAVPWTRFSKEAEEIFEREGAFRRIGLAKIASVQGTGPGGPAQAKRV